MEKKAIQLQLLNEFSTRLQGMITSEDFYSDVIGIIQNKFNYYSIHIWTVEGDEKYILRAQAGGYSSHIQPGYTIPLSQGTTGHAIRTRKTILNRDVKNSPHFTDLSLPVKTRSQLTVPIIFKAEALGALNIESDQVDAFDQDDVTTLEAISAQFAVAINNRKLYLEVRNFNEELKAAVEEKTEELQKANQRILEQQKLLEKENKALKTLVDYDQKGMDIIGKSPALQNILSMVDKIAPTTATVLIQGASGTGKELIARRLHQRSERASKPYVAVNCGALQESLLESELFGHEKGSFTGAVDTKVGLVETADGGTLFLDEIGELSPSIQAKLLRFLQEGEFYRIGGKRPIQVDVRIISATNRDLEKEVRESRFREDLFYRLNIITLRMPPLSKRKEDIPLLVDYFLKSPRFGAPQQIKKISPRVIETLQNYEWPGNIRELQNVIERLKILAENNEIQLEDLPFNLRMPKARAEQSDFSIEMSLSEVEKNHILRVLAYYQGNKTRTAKMLGITIKTLYNKLHSYGVIPSQQNTQASL